MNAPRTAPERTCVGCGAKKPKSALVRVVVGPDGQVMVDRKGVLPGRGAYLCSSACLKGALKRKAFARAFRGKAAPIEPARLESALRVGSDEDSGLDAARRGVTQREKA
ncbi:MAG: YlxR family protein [Myxococcaceae bacterium]|nr:YlxR family protein [Myxococcaceae bacterium]